MSKINGMKPQGKPWTLVPPQRGGVFTIATPRSDVVNVITHSRDPLSSQIKQYGKFGKKMLVGASSGIITGMFLMGVGTSYVVEVAEFSEYSASSYSQNTAENGMHLMRRWNSKAKINSLTGSLGLDTKSVQTELKSGKTLKQVLQENGIETSNLHKTLEKKRGKSNNKNWKSA
ncbi:MAG: hypothetical protein EXS47_00975 [Candidatus Zambryskibacteria bacterium]|nr:hypothetical protein [Candidatus Zambryskibacteria bacterium]